MTPKRFVPQHCTEASMQAALEACEHMRLEDLPLPDIDVETLLADFEPWPTQPSETCDEPA